MGSRKTNFDGNTLRFAYPQVTNLLSPFPILPGLASPDVPLHRRDGKSMTTPRTITTAVRQQFAPSCGTLGAWVRRRGIAPIRSDTKNGLSLFPERATRKRVTKQTGWRGSYSRPSSPIRNARPRAGTTRDHYNTISPRSNENNTDERQGSDALFFPKRHTHQLKSLVRSCSLRIGRPKLTR